MFDGNFLTAILFCYMQQERLQNVLSTDFKCSMESLRPCGWLVFNVGDLM